MLTRRQLLLSAASAPLLAQQTLHNGIVLPADWPPSRQSLEYKPMPVPYLEQPPSLIPIDLGRQLFVDDFLIEQSTLRRVFHQPSYHPASPVLKPDRPWETTAQGPASMVFSDGVWFDPQDQLFKLWYMAGYWGPLAYACSRDGIHWEKPRLDVKPGTNIVLDIPRGSTTVWLDHNEPNPARRFKLFRQVGGERPPRFALHYSPDGIHWSGVAALSGTAKDRSTLFYNPFRRKWVFSLKDDNADQRMRLYWESDNLEEGFFWTKRTTPVWVGADPLDPQRPDLKRRAELYNLDAVAYEGLLLGLFSIWKGQPTDRPKPNQVMAGFSRDGFHWHRPCRDALLPVSEKQGDWNWGNVQSAGGCVLVVRDKLYFYASGRAGVPGTKQDGVCTTGLAILRRDGFASLRAGAAGGVLTTRLLRFSGSQLFVNLEAPNGELRVEILDAEGKIAAGCSRGNCLPLSGDSTLMQVRWQGVNELSRLHGLPLRFRFHLVNGGLYSFWVSPDSSGASRGYVGAGGPGFQGPMDFAGKAALGLSVDRSSDSDQAN
ncbi:glycosyl hydrolase family 32 [Paludibaculum fermentans]|uniref:glycosyl hydrolase family 32 n=1 Tax=Paludibaculum fermentans TaxID=1473598 RepID=UPI003EC0AAEC